MGPSLTTEELNAKFKHDLRLTAADLVQIRAVFEERDFLADWQRLHQTLSECDWNRATHRALLDRNERLIKGLVAVQQDVAGHNCDCNVCEGLPAEEVRASPCLKRAREIIDVLLKGDPE